VSRGLLAPEALKYVFVGGALLEYELYEKALELGWPIVPCYGSTETFAQMSSSEDGQWYKPYPGWETDLNQEGELLLQGPSLFAGQIIGDEFIERLEKPFNTKDIGQRFEESFFKILGKSNGLVKIKGSYFDFNSFKRDFLKTTSAKGFKSNELFPVVIEEKRAGGGLYLVCTQKNINFDQVLKNFKMIRGVFYIQDTDFLSEIGKVSKAKLEDVLSKPVLSL
jgi:O-succinylbenzoic acid--CoA ligase